MAHTAHNWTCGASKWVNSGKNGLNDLEHTAKRTSMNDNEHYSKTNYRNVSNIRRTLVGNKIVDHSDVVGASPVGAAPTTSSFST